MQKVKRPGFEEQFDYLVDYYLTLLAGRPDQVAAVLLATVRICSGGYRADQDEFLYKFYTNWGWEKVLLALVLAIEKSR